MTKPPRKGRPRLEDRAKTVEAKQPWVAKGMSRSTWYRRKREKTAPQAPPQRSRDGTDGGTTNGERE